MGYRLGTQVQEPNLFGTYYPFLPSRIFETSDGNYGVWLNYIPLVSFSNVLMKINPSTNAVAFAKQHNFNLALSFLMGIKFLMVVIWRFIYTLAGTGIICILLKQMQMVMALLHVLLLIITVSMDQ